MAAQNCACTCERFGKDLQLTRQPACEDTRTQTVADTEKEQGERKARKE